MITDILTGYLAAGAFYVGFEFAFMIYKARVIHKHFGNLLFLAILFIPCTIIWPYFSIKRVLHNEKDNI